MKSKTVGALCVLWAGFFVCQELSAEGGSFYFQSGSERVTLLEFFTSENNKNCNRAQEWFAAWKENESLFKTVIPLCFHLDKWDDRFWKDRFAIPESKQRLITYTRFWNTERLYVPVIVVNGIEWNGWSRGQAMPLASGDVGVLSVAGNLKGDFQVKFTPREDLFDDWRVHGAMMGCEMGSHVQRGVNEKKKFMHDFVVLDLESKQMRRPYGSDWKATLKLRVPVGFSPKRRAVAIWVTRGDNPLPLQAVGKYLPGAGDKIESPPEAVEVMME